MRSTLLDRVPGLIALNEIEKSHTANLWVPHHHRPRYDMVVALYSASSDLADMVFSVGL